MSGYNSDSTSHRAERQSMHARPNGSSAATFMVLNNPSGSQ